MWDKIKGMVFEGETAEATPAAKAPAPQGAAQPAQQRPATTTMSFTSAAVNQDMVDMIRKQTFSRNTALTNLITTSDALADVIPDPVMRLKAAQKTAGAGRSGKELAEAVQIHLNDVDAAQMQFGQALEGKIKAEVGSLLQQASAEEARINANTTEIQNLSARIQALQEQIGSATQKRAELQAQAATKEAELRQADTEFKAAAAHVRDELNGHKQTILSTLG